MSTGDTPVSQRSLALLLPLQFFQIPDLELERTARPQVEASLQEQLVLAVLDRHVNYLQVVLTKPYLPGPGHYCTFNQSGACLFSM